MFAALFLALPIVIAPAATVDSWAAFKDATHASLNGQYAVTIHRGKGIHFTLVQRASGAPPLKSAVLSDGLPLGQRNAAPTGSVVLAEGTLKFLPFDVLVSDTGHGFATIETYKSMGYGHSMTTVNAKGVTINALPLESLFGQEEIERLPRTTSSIWWYSKGWIDETSGELIVTASGGGPFGSWKGPEGPTIFAASFERSGVRHGDEGYLLRALNCGSERGAQAALDHFCEADRDGLKPEYIKLSGKEHHTATRLRAALSLSCLGDLRGADLVRRVAFHRDAGTVFALADRVYVLQISPALLGDKAIPLLIDTLRTRPGLLPREKRLALESFGQRAQPFLLAVRDDDVSRPEHKALMADIEASIRAALEKARRAGPEDGTGDER